MNKNSEQNVEGLILYHDLVEWWYTSFSEDERKYIDDRFQPMHQRAHTLPTGTFLKKEGEIIDTALFLNSLATWFRSKSDTSILKRIQEKIDEVGRERGIEGPGYVEGRYFVTYVKDVNELKKSRKIDDAERLLLKLVEATEEASKSKGEGVAPWYYEELAKIYRKKNEYDKEVYILKRFAKQKHARGVGPKKLHERLEKAKILAAKEK